MKPVASAHEWLQRGHELKASGDLSGAVSAYRKAVDLIPTDADAWRFLGNAYYVAKEFNLALGAYQRAVSIKPACPKVWSNLSNTYKNLGQNENSTQAAEKANHLRSGLSQ